MGHTVGGLTLESLLCLRKVSKSFGGIRALDQVDLEVYPAEVLAIVGDNGAGKSTLIKIISGVYQADEGEYRFAGEPVTVVNPKEVKKLGIETVYQNLGLCENLDVTDNLFLGRERYRKFCGLKVLERRRMEEEARRALTELGTSAATQTRKKVRYLSGGQRQAIAIARAASWGTRLVIMDEPTAALGVRESRKALELITVLKNKGIAVILISHNMEHVFQVADRIYVMRQGRCAGIRNKAEATPTEIVRLIMGAE